MWAKLQRLEARLSNCGDKDLQAFMKCLLPAQQQFVRETFIRLLEKGFLSIPPGMASDLEGFRQAWHTTLPIEEMFNEGRRVADLNRAKKLDPEALFHTCAVASPVLEEFGWRGVAVSADGRSVAPTGLPSSVFGLGKQEASITEAEFEEVCSKTPHWPNLAPSTMKSCSLAWRLAMDAEGRWDRMACSWLSLLAQPGSVVVNAREGTCHLVLSVSRFGFLAWRSPVQKDRRLVLAPIPDRSVQFFWVQNVEDWRAAEVQFDFHAATADRPGTCNHVPRQSTQFGEVRLLVWLQGHVGGAPRLVA